MIIAKHRFHGHNSLSFVYRNGRTVRGPLMAIKYVGNSRRTTYRLSIVVSKKISKSAVVRNRIRRRLYEAFRRQEQAITEPTDMVVTVFSDTIAIMPADELDRMVHAQLKQAHIIP